MRVRSALVVLALALPACGGGAPEGGATGPARTESPASGESPVPSPPAVSILVALVVMPETPPEGTQYLTGRSGPISLEDFTANPDERETYEDLGFELALRSFFAAPATQLTPPERPDTRIFSVNSQAALFPDADSAERALSFLRERFRLQPNFGGDAETLGPDAFALEGAISEGPNAPSHYFSYTWRVDAGLCVLYAEGAEGELTAGEVLALAEGIVARAGDA